MKKLFAAVILFGSLFVSAGAMNLQIIENYLGEQNQTNNSDLDGNEDCLKLFDDATFIIYMLNNMGHIIPAAYHKAFKQNKKTFENMWKNNKFSPEALTQALEYFNKFKEDQRLTQIKTLLGTKINSQSAPISE